MKIILLPLFKFIWACILSILPLSIIRVLLLPVISILFIIWNFKLPGKKQIAEWFEYKLIWHHCHVSPYFKKNDNGEWFKNYTFKSWFHYVWNIK